MLGEIAYRFRLGALQRDRAKTVRHYREPAKEARARRDWDAVQEAEQSEWFEVSLLDEEIDYLVSQRLLNRAERVIVAVPPDGEEFWEKGHQTGRRYLTRRGIIELRASLRKEASERSSLLLAWGGWATGLIGALTGLAAVLMNAG